MIDSKTEATLLKYINATPAMLNLLYDTNLLPEQIMAKARGAYRDSPDWDRMLTIVAHWRAEAARKA